MALIIPLIIPAPTHMVFEFITPLNASLRASAWPQVSGDVIYYCPTTVHGGFKTVDNQNFASTGIVRIGLAREIVLNANNRWELTVEIDNFVGTGVFLNPLQVSEIVGGYINVCSSPGDCFLMFSKNTQANRSSLLGYYAEVVLGNDSPDIAELFAVSAEVSESSK